MASLARLSVDFVARTAGFEKGVNNAQKELKGFAGVVGRFSPSMGQLTQKLTAAGSVASGAFTAGFAAAGTAIGVATMAVKTLVDTLHRLDEVVETAGRLNIATAEVQRLGHAFQMLDSDAASAGIAIETMQRNIGKAILTGKDDAFTRLGLSVKELAAMPADDALGAISDKLALLPTQAQRSAAAVAIFGKSATGSIEALTAGSAAIEHFGSEADRLGLTLTELEANQVGKTVDALDRLGAAGEGSLNRLAVAWGPTIEAAASFSTEVLANEKAVKALTSALFGSGTSFGGSFADGFTTMEVAVKDFGRTWDITFTKIALDLERLFNGNSDMAKMLNNRLNALSKSFADDLRSVFDARNKEFGAPSGSLPKLEIKNPEIELTPDAIFGTGPGGSFGEAMSSPWDMVSILGDLIPAVEKIGDMNIATPDAPDALLRSSVAAMSAISQARANPQQQRLNEIAATNKKMLEELKEIARASRDEGIIEMVIP